MKVTVMCGDISTIEVDALMTAINSGGAWFGGIDEVIQRSAGQVFHHQAAQRQQLPDGEAFVAKGATRRRGSFQNVVFIVDDLTKPLHQIVVAGLEEAARAGFKTVSLPTIRMGVMLGRVEKTVEEAIAEIVKGIKLAQNKGSSLDSVTVVVYNDHATATKFEEQLTA
jgi:O-acetyl-ADP-ribose deacetylase (regulator of RNase III)